VFGGAKGFIVDLIMAILKIWPKDEVIDSKWGEGMGKARSISIFEKYAFLGHLQLFEV